MTQSIKLTPTDPVAANMPDGVEKTTPHTTLSSVTLSIAAHLGSDKERTSSANHLVQDQEH